MESLLRRANGRGARTDEPPGWLVDLGRRDVPAFTAGGERPNRIAALRVELRTARAELARIQSHAEDMEWQRNVARAEAERWKLEYRSAMRSFDAVTARRNALVAAIPAAVSAMSMNARTRAWDEGLGGQTRQRADQATEPLPRRGPRGPHAHSG